MFNKKQNKTDNHLKHSSCYTVFSEVNLFDSSSIQLRRCFLFFFFVAISGYLSSMCSNCPYKDDYHRYLMNTGVGIIGALRISTFFMEVFTYLSGVITDVAPFTQVVSCALLAYSAVLCLKIFGINLRRKGEILCFVPVVINPYLLDVMMFRFDNIFIVLALFIVIFAAYLSTLNQKNLILASVALLFMSLFIYQAASFAYIVISVYTFMLHISSGRHFFEIFHRMRCWFLTIAITTVLYIPFLRFIAYFRVKQDSQMFLVPYNLENQKIIFENFITYFRQLWNEWSPNLAGNFCILLTAIFCFKFFVETAKNTKSAFCVISMMLLIFAFFLSPTGTYYFMKIIYIKKKVIDPRVMYSIGILISLLLVNSYRLTQRYFRSQKATNVFGGIVGIFCLWNIVFVNSVTNVFAESFQMQQCIFRDVLKDISEITSGNDQINNLLILGKIKTQKIEELSKKYPVVNQLSFGGWNYTKAALLCGEFAKKLVTPSTSSMMYFRNNEIYSLDKAGHKIIPVKTKVKQRMWYDIFLLNKNILLVIMKHKAEEDSQYVHYMTILK